MAPVPATPIRPGMQPVSKDTIIADAAAEATRRVKAHVSKDLDARDAKVIETAVKRAIEEVIGQEKAIGKAHGWRAAAFGIMGGIGIGILATWAVGSMQSRLATENISFARHLEKAEAEQKQLTRDLNEKLEPAGP